MLPTPRIAERAAERLAVAAGVWMGVNMSRSGRDREGVLFSLAVDGPESRAISESTSVSLKLRALSILELELQLELELGL